MRMRYFISFEVLHYLINVFKCKHCFIVYITQNTNKIRFETIIKQEYLNFCTGKLSCPDTAYGSFIESLRFIGNKDNNGESVT